jgi:hypothetical protein
VCRPADTFLRGRAVSLRSRPFDAGFLSLLVERGQVVLSGFVVAAAGALMVLRWSGTREVDTLPDRRAFLGAYASALRQAGPPSA